MKIYIILDKTKLQTEKIKGLNLAAVMFKTVQVSAVVASVTSE
jgi:hypothetical protein